MSLRADADVILTDFSHLDPQQMNLAQECRNFLASHRDGMWRDCSVGHVTSSALVIAEGSGHVLLTLHPKVGRWLQLGGHIERDDRSVRSAAIREVGEECGFSVGRISRSPIRLDRHPVPCGVSEVGQPILNEHWDLQYLFVVPEVLPPVVSSESEDLRWFSSDDLPELDASVQALIDDAELLLRSSRAVGWMVLP